MSKDRDDSKVPAALAGRDQDGHNDPDQSEYIARILAMSPVELRAEAKTVGVSALRPRSLEERLVSLRLRLESALADRLESQDREAMAWLGEGVIALGAAIVILTSNKEG